MSLRARLQLALTLVMAISFSLFGLLEYDTLSRALLREVDDQLATAAQTIAAIGHPEPLAGEYFEMVAPDGTSRYSSANVSLPRPSELGSFETVRLKPGVTLRVHSSRLPDGSLMILGQSLHVLTSSLRYSLGRIVLAGVITLAISLAVTNVVLGRGLEPLKQVAQTAGAIVLTGDVSQRVPVPSGQESVPRVARSFNSLLERVEEVLQAQARLLSDTSHELRNPLTVIQTDLDMLSRDLDWATRHEVVQEAMHEVARVTRLVNDLLLLSWAEAHPAVRLEPVRLDELAQRCLSRVAPLAAERELALESSRPVTVAGDRDRLEQILRNLLDNAVNYTAPGGSIRVAVTAQDKHAVLTVADNGCGIAPEHLPHLFERFYRVDPSRSRGSGGAGLGLPLARALAQLQEGDLTVQSELGKGTTLRLELPLLNPQ